jgi:hypothetical protein
MVTTGLGALALIRMELGRGGGLFLMLIELAVVGVLVWALTRPGTDGAAKN